MIIPSNAKKVFEGVIFDIYQWEQTLFDGSTTTFETALRASSVNMIAATEDGNILYQVQRQPHRKEAFRCLPCGMVDPGEDPLEAAKRELLEETGYASDDWELLRHVQPMGKVKVDLYSYIARGAKQIADQDLGAGEQIDVELLTLDEFLDLADQEDFCHFDIKAELVRAKYHPESRAKLEEKLFGKRG